MRISEINPDVLTPQQIAILLYPEEPKDSEVFGDCIMVFGGPGLDRAEKAIKLFKEGKAPYLLFSGGDKWGERDEIEAIRMKQLALDQGIPEEAIMIETFSNHTKENVL
ncbi:YdcF family protein [Paenibacillus puerhi]|uniref:YdcF family protein n=1 Tax=Paenibacillus puerhi TaxID=2692622 RepID=UPI0013592C94|nr:YdcF family protein [Paenibacillus puerhi]